MPSVLSPKQVAASLSEFWSPRVVAEVDDAYIKVAKVHGSLAWQATLHTGDVVTEKTRSLADQLRPV